jgi:N-acylneuraminate cytidylyltransferase
MIKLFVSDVDGTLTDGTVYYNADGEQLKRFNFKDGRGLRLLKDKEVITCIITSEMSLITRARFKVLNGYGNLDHYIPGMWDYGKLDEIDKLCKRYLIGRHEVAYIGDDTNDIDVMNYAGYKACPKDANYKVKKVKGIKVMKSKGGYGCVREYIDYLIKRKLV